MPLMSALLRNVKEKFREVVAAYGKKKMIRSVPLTASSFVKDRKLP